LALAVLLLAVRPAAAQVASASTTEPAPFRDCASCPELVVVPAGAFQMGSTETETKAAGLAAERAATERPQHLVTIARGFAIGRKEISVGEFAVYAEQTGFSGKGCWGLVGGAWQQDPAADWRDPGFEVTDASPAVCLSRDDFAGYLAWLSKRTGHRYRLPSEAEWEYAAQLGDPARRIVATGDAAACGALNGADASLRAAIGKPWPSFDCDDGHPWTAPIGSFPANALGMHDVFGNVAEFTADCYLPNHLGAPGDGSVRVTGPACAVLTVKGGSWAGEPAFFRPAFRVTATPQVRGTGFGARVVRELDSPETPGDARPVAPANPPGGGL
jgi:formylglycine-generating enzyme required for sulfatase activity